MYSREKMYYWHSREAMAAPARARATKDVPDIVPLV